MIRAEAYIKVEFDDEGQKRISEAIETLEEVYDAVTKISSCGWVSSFGDTIDALREMLDGQMY